jgi:hypothetical protein
MNFAIGKRMRILNQNVLVRAEDGMAFLGHVTAHGMYTIDRCHVPHTRLFDNSSWFAENR